MIDRIKHSNSYPVQANRNMQYKSNMEATR